MRTGLFLHLSFLPCTPEGLVLQISVTLPARSWHQREPPDGKFRPCHQCGKEEVAIWRQWAQENWEKSLLMMPPKHLRF